jgi:phosphotransacetylase
MTTRSARRFAYYSQALQGVLSESERERITRALEVTEKQLVGHCVVCGRKLEDPESVLRKIGPDCLAKRVLA